VIRIGRAEVEAVQGDITTEDVDAIICPANNYLWMGSGIAGRLKKAGGAGIETEAVAQGPVEVGSAVVTSGGTLRARNVVHAAAMGQDLKTQAEAVAEATANSLQSAEANGCRALALADIGTAEGGLEVHLCAKIMVDAVIDHLLQTDRIDGVRFVLEDEKTCQVFHDHLLARFSSRR
jgi:O-acetyl-ADP-ribose deacetylase (regulator of RNase III)